MVRRVASAAFVVLGALCALLGLALAVFLGPDNRRASGPHPINTSESVLVTAPRVVEWMNVQVDVLAEVPAKKPVFVGVGNTVDVRALVRDVDRVEITSFQPPWKPTLKARDGDLPTVQGAPTAMDWWLDSSAGLGGASVTSALPDEPVSIAVISIGSSNLSGLKVTFAYGIKGGFLKGVGLMLIGSGIAAAGASVFRSGPGRQTSDDSGSPNVAELEEAVTYIYIDDDGTEHELTEQELAELDGQYEIVDESQEP